MRFLWWNVVESEMLQKCCQNAKTSVVRWNEVESEMLKKVVVKMLKQFWDKMHSLDKMLKSSASIHSFLNRATLLSHTTRADTAQYSHMEVLVYINSWCGCLLSRAGALGATQCWVAPSALAWPVVDKMTCDSTGGENPWRNCLLSRARAHGATQYCVAPRVLTRLRRQPRQGWMETSSIVSHFVNNWSCQFA
jgi:hypothetical protein